MATSRYAYVVGNRVSSEPCEWRASCKMLTCEPWETVAREKIILLVPE